MGTTAVTNACIVFSFASVLRLSAADLFSHLALEAQAAAVALGSPDGMETATTLLLRAFCHDILASWTRGHPLDALIFLYFPHPAMLRAVVVVVHTQGSSVAIDVLRGPSADASSPLLGCLQAGVLLATSSDASNAGVLLATCSPSPSLSSPFLLSRLGQPPTVSHSAFWTSSLGRRGWPPTRLALPWRGWSTGCVTSAPLPASPCRQSACDGAAPSRPFLLWGEWLGACTGLDHHTR